MRTTLLRSTVPVVARSILLSFLAALALPAQQPSPRLAKEIDNSLRVTLPGTHPPMAKAENDAGELPAGAALEGIGVVLRRTAAQESDLQALIAAQQTIGSPEYHKWLSPEEFAARFGVADSDLAAVRQWLEEQGLVFLGVSRSRNRIAASATAGQLQAAFGLAMHYYTANGEKHYAPSSDITVPEALAPLLLGVTNLSTFRPRPHVKLGRPRLAAGAHFTSSQSGSHFLTPKDIATIYNLDAAYGAGYTGSGQAIAVVGQSSVLLSDIEHFQSAAGFSKKDPALLLVPNSGTAAVVAGDEAESDLDLEYTSTVGRDAAIYFVYVGGNPNYSVWDSIEYAVDQKVAPIISVSYGICETALSAGDYAALNAVLAQAAAQGQTVVAASGDAGSTDCHGVTGLSVAEQQALAVDFPASSQYVTGMGGTEFSADDVQASNTTYWSGAGSTDAISSARSYIPELVWNDDSATNGLAAGGGGVSRFTARPAWQTGVAGIPSGNYRLLPDLALDSSAENAGYLYCSSDSHSTGVTGSCSHGFRDSSNTYLTVAGGTSFASPIFAGMLSLLNQKLDSDGQGAINPILYSLAANATTYSSAFHDISRGSNKCTAGSNNCSAAGASEYSAGAGYDPASGLGSVDFYQLLLAWPGSDSSAVPSTTTLTAATTTPSSGESDTVTITVQSASSSVTTIPTGTLTVLVDGATASSDLALASGRATYVFSSDVAGSHTVTAVYSGDQTFAASSGSLSLTVGGAKTFTLSGSNVTVRAGSSSSSTITVTPKNGYAGTIAFAVSSSPTLTNGCFSLPNATVSSANAVTATLTVATSSSACSSASMVRGSGPNFLTPGTSLRSRSLPCFACGMVLAWAACLFVVRDRRSRRLFPAGALLLLAGAALAAAGCSGTTSSSHKAGKGTYTVTIVGSDVAAPSITATTTLRVTVD